MATPPTHHSGESVATFMPLTRQAKFIIAARKAPFDSTLEAAGAGPTHLVVERR